MTSTNPTTITAQPGLPFTDIVREFDAPLAAVFRAHSEPELVEKWLGPRDTPTTVGEYDVRTGGSWSYSGTDDDGNVYGFRGTFHSVTPGENIVQTFEFEGAPGHVSLESLTFDALTSANGERTRIVGHAVYQSVEDRDAMIESGMEHGVVEGYERLDELLAASGE